MVAVSSIAPPSAEAQQRTDAFLEKLAIPIGGLPEDAPADAQAGASPFRVVGVSIAIIGLLLLAVSPFVGGGMVLALDAGIGAGLLLLGGLIAWAGR